MKQFKFIQKLLGIVEPDEGHALFDIQGHYPPQPTPVAVFYAELCKVRDGDTQEYQLNKHHNDATIKPIRLLGVDTYETRGLERSKGIADRQFVLGWLQFALENVDEGHAPFVIQTVATDKYGRWLGWVWRTCDSSCLNVDILKYGFGKPAPSTAQEFLLRDVAKTATEMENSEQKSA